MVVDVIRTLILAASLVGMVLPHAHAGDVHVNSYYRSDGTYVSPYAGLSADAFTGSNYGPSQNNSQLLNPLSRDYEHDGVPNYLSPDDDGDGIVDGRDPSQYRRGWR
jgi:hypothetical protein